MTVLTYEDSSKPIMLLRDSNLPLSAARDAAEQVAQRLRSLSTSTGPSDADTYFYTRVRVKTHSSIVEKVIRKQTKEDDPYYSFRDLTDLVGFRIVTLFDDQLRLAIESVIKTIESGQRLSQPLFDPTFLWNSFHDGRFVCRNGDENDIYRECHAHFVRMITEYYNKNDESKSVYSEKCVIEKAPWEGFNPAKYSSAHLTFWARSYMKNNIILIPVEFQVRAVSEDIWSEINHKFLYKLKNQFAWHPAFAKSYAQAEEHSKDLKKATDELSRHVLRFRNSSNETTKYLGVFQEPRTEYHFSYCMALFDELGTDYTTHFADRILRHLENIVKLKGGRTSLRSQQAAALLASSIHEMSEIIKSLDGLEGRNIDGIGKATVAQKKSVIKFEICRLTYMLFLYTGFKLDKDGRLSKLERRETEDAFMRLYADVCNIKNDPQLLLNPSAVFLFWKYLISSAFDDFVSIENLKHANDVIDDDATVPAWSIYHILIPNRLAAEMLEEAIAISTVRATIESKGRLVGLDAEIRVKLIDALRLAVKAFDRHVVYDPKRGDLIFGAEEEASPLSEATLVLEIVRFHDKVLPPRDAPTERKPLYLGQPISALLPAVDAVESSLKLRAGRLAENQEHLSSLVKDARRILNVTTP